MYRRKLRPNKKTIVEEVFVNSESENEESESDYLPSESDISETFSGATDSESDEPTAGRGDFVPRNDQQTGFAWTQGNFRPSVHKFDNVMSGILVDDVNENSCCREFFELFFSPDMLGKIAAETNRYAHENMCTNEPGTSKQKPWSDTDWEEMYLFLAVTMLFTRQKKLSIKEYWSTDPLMFTPIFGNTMSRDRYLLLLRYLHLCSNELQPTGDRLYKIQMVIDDLKKNMREVYYPFQNLVIDEELLLFKGRLSFQQYIPSKRHRFGIKLFVLCDCETGFIVDFIVYTGHSTNITLLDVLGTSGSVVSTMMAPFLNKGHTLFVDNWYTSPQLFQYLHEKKTNACGTVRKHRKGLPPTARKLKKGEFEAMHTQNILFVRWQDRREVTLLSTMHTMEMKETGKKNRATGEDVLKPSCVLEYNLNMGGIDKCDMLLSSVQSVRKSTKWYKKLFFHFVDFALLNAYALHKIKTGENLSLADFQLKVISEMVQKYAKLSERTKRGRPSLREAPTRLSGQHFLATVPPTEKKAHPTKPCRVCSQTRYGPKKRKETRYLCEQCVVPLCLIPCFKKYHTLSKF